MSYITDVLVVLDYIAPDAEARLTNALPFDTERQASLRRIDMDGAGGTKVFCSHVYAGAFNYLATEAFEDWVNDVLRDAYNVVVWMSTEGEFHRVLRPGLLDEALG